VRNSARGRAQLIHALSWEDEKVRMSLRMGEDMLLEYGRIILQGTANEAKLDHALPT